MDPKVINEPDADIAAMYPTWERNRNLIEGAQAVRASSTNYIPMVSGQDLKDYRAYVARIPFTPGASRVHQGLMGMIFRKPATITAPTGLKDVIETITATGFTLDDLAEELQSELLITNFTGLVTDYPAAPKGVTKANAIDLGYRPFVALYQAESILGIETRVINNRQRVVRVRLLDDVDTVRELRLDDAVYSITIHHNNGGHWTADAPIVPTKNGKPLDEIPFTLSSTSRGFKPKKAPLTDVCEANVDHYLAAANLATMEYMTTVSVINVMGGDMNPKNYPVYPGALWLFGKVTVKTSILQPDGSTIKDLRQTKEDAFNVMTIVGSRILAGDKNAVEAADTLRLRSNADQSYLASLSRVKDRDINDTLSWMSWWMDLPEDTIRYDGSTDFDAEPMTQQEAQLRMQQWQAGVFSLTALHDQYRAGSWLPENFDSDLEKDRMNEEIQAAPPTDA